MRYRCATFVAALTMLAACGKDSTAPASPLVGTYSLTSISGQPLPFVFPNDTIPEATDTLVYYHATVSATISIAKTGRFVYDVNGQYDLVAIGFPLTPAPLVQRYVGKWSDLGSQVRMVIDSSANGSNPMTAVAYTFYLEKSANSSDLVWNLAHEPSSLGPPPDTVTYPHVYIKE